MSVLCRISTCCQTENQTTLSGPSSRFWLKQPQNSTSCQCKGPPRNVPLASPRALALMSRGKSYKAGEHGGQQEGARVQGRRAGKAMKFLLLLVAGVGQETASSSVMLGGEGFGFCSRIDVQDCDEGVPCNPESTQHGVDRGRHSF